MIFPSPKKKQKTYFNWNDDDDIFSNILTILFTTGTSGGGGAQGLVHWMSVMAEHMGGGHHDPSHYALPPWNNGGVDVSDRF